MTSQEGNDFVVGKCVLPIQPCSAACSVREQLLAARIDELEKEILRLKGYTAAKKKYSALHPRLFAAATVIAMEDEGVDSQTYKNRPYEEKVQWAYEHADAVDAVLDHISRENGNIKKVQITHIIARRKNEN